MPFDTSKVPSELDDGVSESLGQSRHHILRSIPSRQELLEKRMRTGLRKPFPERHTPRD